MAGHFYQPPPPFIGGRQPYAPKLGIPQTGGDKPPIQNRATHAVIRAYYDSPPRFVGGEQPYAAPLGLVQSGNPVVSGPPPRDLRAFWTIDASNRREAWTTIGITQIAPQAEAPATPDDPPKRSYVTLRSIIDQWQPVPNRPPPLRGIGQFSVPIVPDNPPVKTYTVFNPDSPVMGAAVQAAACTGEECGDVARTDYPESAPVLTYQNRNTIHGYWTQLPPAVVSQILATQSGEEIVPPTVYPTVLEGLDPAYESGLDWFYDFSPITSEGNTVTLDDDGTYTVSGSPVEGEYFTVQVYDYSTGIEHVMSPFRAYVDGTIRIGDYTGLEAGTVLSLLAVLGITSSLVYAYSDTIDLGDVIAQSEDAYWVLTDDIVVTLTVSLGAEPIPEVITVNTAPFSRDRKGRRWRPN